jgi:hypothetical protein
MGASRASALAFFAGAAIAAHVLTRDTTVGEDVLSALASGEIWTVSQNSPSSVLSVDTRDTLSDASAVDGFRDVHRAKIEALELGEATRAALAATKLTLALWARVFSPATNALWDALKTVLRASGDEGLRFLRETEPKVLALWALACVGAMYAVHACRRLVKHLKRARYRNKLKFFIIRTRMRASRRVRAMLEPYAKVYRSIAAVGMGVRRRYSLVVHSVRNKSRMAANALPHGIFLVLGFTVFRIMPRGLRLMLKKREALATIALLIPMFQTMLAVESNDMALVEKWLRFWASCAPFMMAVDFPFIFYGVRWFFPWWPETLVLFTIWLNLHLTRGSHLIVEFFTPIVAQAMAYLNNSPGRLSMIFRRSVRQALQLSVIVLRFRSRRAADAMRLVIDNMSIPLVMCTMFFFTPGLITIYGCDMAGLVVPFAFTVDGLLQYNELKAQQPNASRAQARKEAEKHHEEKLRNWLTYWLAHAMLWSLSQELSKSVLGWFPLWRHTQLVGIYWLQVFGGAERITERMQGIKEKVMQDHQQALKAAIAADLEASEAEERERAAKSDDASVDTEHVGEEKAESIVRASITDEGLRKRTVVADESPVS